MQDGPGKDTCNLCAGYLAFMEEHKQFADVMMKSFSRLMETVEDLGEQMNQATECQLRFMQQQMKYNEVFFAAMYQKYPDAATSFATGEDRRNAIQTHAGMTHILSLLIWTPRCSRQSI